MAGLVLTTAGFFAAHSVASGWVGGRAPVAPAQASALYLCLYYIGSSVAGSAGGMFYARGGWPPTAAFAAHCSRSPWRAPHPCAAERSKADRPAWM